MLIGIAYDLQEDYLAQGFSAEDAAEFDRRDTIDAIAGALSQLGHTPDPIGNLDALMQRLQNGERWDLVFNIAEGCYGFAREAQVPALLDAYRIPYTFSDAMTLGLCLHKGMCKRIVRDGGVPTPAFAVIETPTDADTVNLPFPLFAKPVAEGTGKGVSGASKVSDREALKRVCGTLLERFQQPVLIETYLPGREFTVGIVGTGRDARALGVMEVLFGEQAESTNYSYQNKTDWIGKLDYRIPEEALAAECAQAALAAWRTLGCRDAGRIDLRFDAAGCPQFIEVNPLAGINPDISDLCILCGLYGISYANLIGWIVESACTRMKNSPAKARSASRSVGCKPAFAARCLPLLPQEEGWDEGNQLPPSPNPLPEGEGTRTKGSPSLGEGLYPRPPAAVLYGAVAADAGADEQDTLIEVNAVSATLAALDYRAEPIEMTLDLARVRQRLEYLKPEFVFNLVTSIAGDDRCQHLAPTLLDSMHLAYTGAPLTAMLATANKLDVKQRLRAHGLPTPDWRTAAELPTRENGIWIVKSAWLHASVGLDDGAVVPGTKLRDVLNRADSTWFAERYIDGREINVALLEDGRGAPEVLPTAEIEFYDFPAGKPRIVGYAAKWNPESFEYRHTRRRFLNDSEAALIEELKRLARACWTRFGLRGYARIDFRIDAEGRPWILEINTNPCLSPDAGFAAAAAKADLDSQALIARIVQAAGVPSSSATTQSDSCSAYAASTT